MYRATYSFRATDTDKLVTQGAELSTGVPTPFCSVRRVIQVNTATSVSHGVVLVHTCQYTGPEHQSGGRATHDADQSTEAEMARMRARRPPLRATHCPSMLPLIVEEDKNESQTQQS